MGLEQVSVADIPRAAKTGNPGVVHATRSGLCGSADQKKNKGEVIEQTASDLGISKVLEESLGCYPGGIAWMSQGGGDENR
jgi:hypothetical protein